MLLDVLSHGRLVAGAVLSRLSNNLLVLLTMLRRLAQFCVLLSLLQPKRNNIRCSITYRQQPRRLVFGAALQFLHQNAHRHQHSLSEVLLHLPCHHPHLQRPLPQLRSRPHVPGAADAAPAASPGPGLPAANAENHFKAP